VAHPIGQAASCAVPEPWSVMMTGCAPEDLRACWHERVESCVGSVVVADVGGVFLPVVDVGERSAGVPDNAGALD
jgi:hypothetical protein